MSTDLSEMTKEDGTVDSDKIEAMLDKIAPTEEETVAKEIAEEEPSEPAPDQPEEKQTVAETDDEPAGDDEETSWASVEEIRELVDTLGYTDEQMKGFSDRDAFDHHVQLMDQRDLKELEPDDTEEETSEEETRKPDASERAKEQPRSKDGSRFVKAEDAEWTPSFKSEGEQDEEGAAIVADLSAVDKRAQDRLAPLRGEIAELRGEIAEFHQREADAAAMQELERFDSMLTDMGHEDLFGNGKPEDRTKEQWDNRGKAYKVASDLLEIARRRGKPVGVSEAIVRRALNQEFADKLIANERRSVSDKARKQSGRKMGGGRPRSEPDQVHSGDPTQDPELKKLYRQMQEENGDL